VKKAIVVIFLICAGAKYGVDYFLSEKFQEYGDRTKKPWTCQADICLGEFMTLMSHYHSAGHFFKKAIDRCPDSTYSEDAEFEYAQSLEYQGERANSVAAYDAYAEKYPTTERGRLAAKSAGMMR
jgi:TolA-binding protein